MTDCLQTRIRARLDEDPTAHALAFFNSNGECFWQSRERLHSEASAYARKLAAAGVVPGDICLMVLPSEKFCATLLTAILISGAVPLLIAPPILQGDTRHSSLFETIKRILTRAKVKLMVGHSSLQQFYGGLLSISPDTAFLFGENHFLTTPDDRPFNFVSRSGDDTAALQLTSGTTGMPRICRWQQHQVLAALDGMAAAMALGPNDMCLNWTPLYHDMGLANNFLLCLASGTPLVMLSPTDFVKKPALWLRALSETGATITWAPNFGYALTTERVKEEEIAGIELKHVRTFWNAAEKIHLQTLVDFQRRFAKLGVRADSLKMNFGCVENVGGATFTALEEPYVYERVDAEILQKDRVAKRLPPDGADNPAVVIVGVGRPHPNLRVVIQDDHGTCLSEGNVGEILLDTPSRMTEYVSQREETSQALRGALVRTGDLGYLRNGELFWVGRLRERINVRGRKIDPSEFEAVLWDIPGIRKGCFAAFGIDQVSHGTERVVLVAELNPSVSNCYADVSADIIERASVQLGLRVSEVVLVEKGTLSKTSSGKRRHQHFRDVYLAGGLNPVYRSSDTPAHETESLVAS